MLLWSNLFSFSPLCHYLGLWSFSHSEDFLLWNVLCILWLTLEHLLSAGRPGPYMAPNKAFFLWRSVFLAVVDLEHFLASQLDIFCKHCHSQDGSHLPCISLLSCSFVHVSLIDYLISLLSRVPQLHFFFFFLVGGCFRIWLVIAILNWQQLWKERERDDSPDFNKNNCLPSLKP